MASTDGYVEGPRHGVVTSDNVGPVLTIVTMFLMVVMILAVALRLLVRFTTSHVPGYDDAVVSIAMVAALAEVIAISLSVNHGLGRRLDALPPAQLDDVRRGIYAGDLFYLTTIALAKASTLFLLHRLTVSMSHKWTVRVIGGIIAAWFIAALFGTAFRCHLPNPWTIQANECFDIVEYWDAIGSIDIFLDVALVLMPAWVVWSLQMPVGRKAVVVLGFSFRLLLPAIQIVRLTLLHRYRKGIDSVYSSMGYVMCTQFETTLSVVVACIPAFKPFMDRAASGLIAISFRDRQGTYELSSVNNRGGRSGGASKLSSGNGNGSRVRPQKSEVFAGDGDYHAEISAASRSDSTVAAQRRDPDHIAHKTVEWEVHYSDEAMLNQRQNWPPSPIDATNGERQEHRPGSSVQATYHDI